MLSKLYWLYQKPEKSKKVDSSKKLSKAFEKLIPIPKKADDTRWIDFKFWAMRKFLENYGLYKTHLEQLTHTHSQT